MNLLLVSVAVFVHATAEPAPSALHQLATVLTQQLQTRAFESPMCLWAQGTPKALAQATLSLLAAPLAEQNKGPTVIDASDAAQAEAKALEKDCRSLVRLEVGQNPTKLWAAGDAISIWKNFWSGSTPRRQADAVVLSAAVQTDSVTANFEGVSDAGVSDAGTPTHKGGSLRLAAVTPSAIRGEPESSLVEAALARLSGSTLCAPPFAVTSAEPKLVRIDLPPTQRAEGVVKLLERIRMQDSPNRALLSSVESVRAVANAVEIRLAYEWPDLRANLCHPVFTIPSSGPFTAQQNRYLRNAAFPEPSAQVDEIALTTGNARSAQRQFASHRSDMVLGLSNKSTEARAFPYATFLLAGSTVPKHFHEAFRSAIALEDLVRFFVKSPARAASLPAGSKVSAVKTLQELTLAFDASSDDHRAVATRIQVKLSSLGYRLALRPMSPQLLEQARSSGEYQLMLISTLMPNPPASKLAVKLELSRQTEVMKKLLPELGSISDDAARAEATQKRGDELFDSTRAVELYRQGLPIQISSRVQNLQLDEYGLPQFEQLFLQAPSAP